MVLDNVLLFGPRCIIMCYSFIACFLSSIYLSPVCDMGRVDWIKNDMIQFDLKTGAELSRRLSANVIKRGRFYSSVFMHSEHQSTAADVFGCCDAAASEWLLTTSRPEWRQNWPTFMYSVYSRRRSVQNLTSGNRRLSSFFDSSEITTAHLSHRRQSQNGLGLCKNTYKNRGESHIQENCC